MKSVILFATAHEVMAIAGRHGIALDDDPIIAAALPFCGLSRCIRARISPGPTAPSQR